MNCLVDLMPIIAMVALLIALACLMDGGAIRRDIVRPYDDSDINRKRNP